MRTLKMLGLAAIAALGLMAFVGAGTASATTLCKTPGVNPCPTAWDWPVGTSLHASTKAETSVRLTSPAGTTVATCTLTVTADLEQTSAPVLVLPIHLLEWTNCTTTVKNITTGKLTVKRIAENEAEVTADETRVTVVLGGVSCTYAVAEGGTKLGTIKGGSNSPLNIEVKVKKVEGSFVCPTEPIWDANLVITEPNPVYITE